MSEHAQPCRDHAPLEASAFVADDFERASAIFRAAGDPERLKILEALARTETCVSELAAIANAAMSTVSQRLRLLRSEGLVAKRREGRHIYYRLADDHIAAMVTTALENARRPEK